MPWAYLKTLTLENVDKKKDYFIYHSKRAYYKELNAVQGERHLLCFNPEKFIQERKDRAEKIESIKKYFENKNKVLSQSKKKRNRGQLREELQKYLKNRGAHKIFRFRLYSMGKSFKISYRTDDIQVRELAKFDGIYVIASNVKETKATAEDLINAYRDRMEIERSFHQLKSFVEIRPIYHQIESRIKAHIGICVLSYLLNTTVKHMVRQKKNFEELTAQSVYSYLNSCKLIELQANGKKKLKITTPTSDQIKLTKILADENIFDPENIKN
jgi:transposase